MSGEEPCLGGFGDGVFPLSLTWWKGEESSLASDESTNPKVPPPRTITLGLMTSTQKLSGRRQPSSVMFIHYFKIYPHPAHPSPVLVLLLPHLLPQVILFPSLPHSASWDCVCITHTPLPSVPVRSHQWEALADRRPGREKVGSFSIPAGTNGHTLSSLKQQRRDDLTVLEVRILNPFLWVKNQIVVSAGLAPSGGSRREFIASPFPPSGATGFPWQVAPPSVFHASSRASYLISHLRLCPYSTSLCLTLILVITLRLLSKCKGIFHLKMCGASTAKGSMSLR